MFVVVKLKTVLKVLTAAFAAAVVLVSATFFVPKAVTATLATTGEYTVVLDPGHGGVDAGVIGAVSKARESDVNLKISKKVKRLLNKNNIDVVMTRETQDGLYGDDMTNFKKRDMAKRKEIILSAAPDVMVSVHCNKFPDASRRGAQVFFEPRSETSVALANGLQSALNLLNKENLGKTYAALKGDYYMLKCSNYPSAIVECGFLSNPEDDRLLNDNAYQEKLAYQIFSGIVAYLKTSAASPSHQHSAW